jgi:hypothetical protein
MEKFIISIVVSLGLIILIFELHLQLQDHLKSYPKKLKKPKTKIMVRMRRIRHVISSIFIVLGFIFFIVKEVLKNIFFYYKKIINDWTYKKIESFENWLL